MENTAAQTTSLTTADSGPTIPKGFFAALPGMATWEADQLKDAYDAITTAEKWQEMATFSEPSFMMSQAPWLNEVQRNMKLLDHHSGASYGCMMRIMEMIATHGWDAYVANYIQKHEEEERGRTAREADARRRADTEEAALNTRRFERWIPNEIHPICTYHS